MKNIFVALAMVLVCSFMLAACGSRYIAVTKDYNILIGSKKPVVDPTNDTITVEDENGVSHTMPREDLKKMRSL